MIGTSGWIYPHWRDRFYPRHLKQADWLAYYAERFATVEINYSFYRLPSEETFDRWRETAPPGFVYALKANRYLTHVKRLKDCAEPLGRFLERARRLGTHLGPILYQLPPHWRANAERLADFAELLPPDLIHIFEFRDDRWFVESVKTVLERHGLGFCIHDMAGVNCPQWRAGQAAYFRFHGSSHNADGGYGERELRAWARELEHCLETGRAVFAYFNNDAGGNAVRDAQELRRLVHRGP
jgi:uncharacterized protein YecE (DUF72 family)